MTQFWTILDTQGVIIATCVASSSADVHPKDEGFAWVEGEQVALAIDGPVDLAAQIWDGSAWVLSVPILRERKWTAVKARRDVATDGGCETPLGRADSDEGSRGKIVGAVQMAQIAMQEGRPFAIDWTMQDNATVAHDAPAMVAMGVAVGQHVAACHEVALGKRAAIEAAETAEAIAAVDIEEDGPMNDDRREIGLGRYALFCCPMYYPAGGWDDLIDFFDDVAAAMLWLESAEFAGIVHKNISGTWWHIVDTSSREIISRGEV